MTKASQTEILLVFEPGKTGKRRRFTAEQKPALARRAGQVASALSALPRR